MNLFMVSLGGKAKGGNIEVHDVQFVAANHIDETIEVLKKNWYGLPLKLHMDSYKLITGAEGFSVKLTEEKPENSKQLYFVHLGGYLRTSTQEQHEIFLCVGDKEQEVKDRVVKLMTVSDIENHVDSIVNVETCMLSADGKKYYIELMESQEDFLQDPDWFGYRRIDIENQ